MNLLIIVRRLDTGGAEMLECRLAVELKKKGIRVFLAGQYSENQFSGRVSRGYWLAKGVDGVFWLRYTNFIRLPVCIYRLFEIIRLHKISHVITHNEGGDIMAGIAKLLINFKHVIAFHTYYPSLRNSFKSWLWKSAVRRAAWSYSISQYVSGVNASTFGYNKTKTSVIYNSFNGIATSASAEIPEGPFIFLVGRIHPQKGYEIALQVLAKVFSEKKDIVALIAGPNDDKEYRQRLNELSTKLGISNRVTFLGSVTNIGAYMRKATVLLHAAAHEGFGLVLLEAINNDLPLVSVTTGGIPEVLRSTPFNVFTPHDIDGLTKEVFHYLSMSDEQKKELFLFKNSFLSYYSDERRANEIYGILKNLCAASVE